MFGGPWRPGTAAATTACCLIRSGPVGPEGTWRRAPANGCTCAWVASAHLPASHGRRGGGPGHGGGGLLQPEVVGMFEARCGDLGLPSQRIPRRSFNPPSLKISFNHEIRHLAKIFRRAMADRDFATGSPSAYAANTTEVGSRRRVIGGHRVHLGRNRP